MIDVEQRPLSAFKKHPLAGAYFLIEQQSCIGHIVFEFFPIAGVALMNLVEVKRVFP